MLFAQTEGIIPASETDLAIKAAIDETLKCKKERTQKIIAFNFSGHGLLDLAAYDSYLQDDLVDYAHPEEMILAYDKFQNHLGQLRHVVFADGHVEKMTELDFQQAVARDNQQRRTLGLPEKPADK